jgi:hypothetical protein
MLVFVGLCQQQTSALRGMRDVGHRWRELLASGCRTGTEMERVCKLLREEAIQSGQFIERELSGPLRVEGAGEGIVDGSTRWMITTWIEDTRAAVLRKALEVHYDQAAHQFRVNPQLDKLI